jgi:RND family efflux transporter MFP subunit
MPVPFVFLVVSSTCRTAGAQDGIAAFTSPSADVILSFVQFGRIAQVLPKEGSAVKPDEVLVQQDDSVEQIRLTVLKARSENTSQLKASRASLDQKKIDLEKLVWAAERGASTEQEVRIAELSLEISNFDHEQNEREYAAEKARVDMMTLRSPIAGRVEQIDVEVGETVSAAIPVIRVVRIDPLWIDVHVSIEQAFKLKLGQTASVVFSDDPESPVPGKITFIAAVADSGSSTLRTRLEVSNKSERPAGQNVTVLLEDLND